MQQLTIMSYTYKFLWK